MKMVFFLSEKRIISNKVLLYTLTCGLGVRGDADDKLDLLRLGEFVQPGDKGIKGLGRLVLNQLVEVVHKDMGDVIVAGMDTADEAL